MSIIKKNKIIRSPFFYVGDKYKLMTQLLKFFPKDINNFYEPFTGGGSVFLNVKAKKYFLNDIDRHFINMHKFFVLSSKNKDLFFKNIFKIISKYKLSRSYVEDIVPKDLKMKYKKTYYAVFNKTGYDKLKLKVNNYRKNDPSILYILLIYGFNRMLRFNGGGKFNLPVGNVDFNTNVVNSLNDYFDKVNGIKTKFTCKDFRRFLKDNNFEKNDFVYVDPPYLITFSEYNKLWGPEEEKELLKELDILDKRGVRFALSNVVEYKGKKNELLFKWMKKYKIHKIDSNYISYHNNSKKEIKEVLITNY